MKLCLFSNHPPLPRKPQSPRARPFLLKKESLLHGKSASKGKQHQPPPPPRALSFWDQLSAERKLDVVGIILAFTGIIIILGLVSANRSAVIGGAIFFISQIFGWGLYILPLGLLVFGLWLVFRKIERIPPLSLERVVGSVILFLWLLTFLHIIATLGKADTAEAVALTGKGGGALGGLFQRVLWFGLGGGGAFVFIAGCLVNYRHRRALDKPVQDLILLACAVDSTDTDMDEQTHRA